MIVPFHKRVRIPNEFTGDLGRCAHKSNMTAIRDTKKLFKKFARLLCASVKQFESSRQPVRQPRRLGRMPRLIAPPETQTFPCELGASSEEDNSELVALLVGRSRGRPLLDILHVTLILKRDSISLGDQQD